MKYLKSKIVSYFLIPTLLFFMGCCISLIFSPMSFLTLIYPIPAVNVHGVTNQFLTKGDKILAEFKAEEDNLGIVFFRFRKNDNPDNKSTDALYARIKEKKSTNWMYTNFYTIGNFDKEFLLPFGFPVIEGSRGKEYVVEVESAAGNKANSVILSKIQPAQSDYKFNKNQMGKPKTFVRFIYKKVLTSITNVNFLFSSIVYFLPFLAYSSRLFLRGRISFSGRILYYFILALALLDSFFIPFSSDGIMIGIFLLWLFIIKHYKLGNTSSFSASLILVFFQIFCIFSGLQNSMDKLGTYVYAFFTVGVVQLMIDYSRKYKKAKK